MNKMANETVKAPQTGVKATQTANIGAAAKTAPVAGKKTLSLADLTEMVNADMGLMAIAEKTGSKRYDVQKALKQFGLKTKAMRAIKKASFLATNSVFEAVKQGMDDYNDIASWAGVDVAMVEAIVKKLKKEGVLKTKLSVS